ncbi:hypothetical protein DdX_05299 [Ditylenchus destructor]|uniref:Uncharacterized protein n=1 Tax=Ditylenchus destructor TaxID=166010 RepID=A0AAD4R9V6_9BILA|nr:hypothetical protein DdX_05299 [Ditylenchus destructor]
MAKFFRFLKPKKAAGKENILDDEDNFYRQSRRVNFARENSNNRIHGRKNYSYNSDENDDDSSEVTLKAPSRVPINPYHVITEPKKNKGPRSCPGGPMDMDDMFSSRGHARAVRGAASTIGEQDLSFQSEFQLPERHRSNKMGRSRKIVDSRHSQPLRELANGRLARDQQVSKTSNRRNYYKNVNQNDSQDDDEWTSQRIPKYEEKYQELHDRYCDAINKWREMKQEKKRFQKMYNEQFVRNRQLQAEIEALREIIYQQKMEFQRATLSIHRDDYHASSYHQQLMAQLTLAQMQHPPSLTPLLSHTGTTSSTVNGAGGVSLTGGTPRQQPHNILPGSNGLNEVGSGESLAVLSSSSMCLGQTHSNMNHYNRASQQMKVPPLLTSSTSNREQSKYMTIGSRPAMRPSSSTAFSPRLLQHPPMFDDISGDEVKIFRREHVDSFSGTSSKPEEIDEEMEKIKQDFCNIPSTLSSKSSNQDNDASSPQEYSRNCRNVSNELSVNSLDMSLYDDSFLRVPPINGHRGVAATLHDVFILRDDGYSTKSETASTVVGAQPSASNSRAATASDSELCSTPQFDKPREKDLTMPKKIYKAASFS